MANPQKENGHLDIANEIAEVMARTHLTPTEHQILWVIFRKTYGWNKKNDEISLGQFVESTGISKPNICRALSKLITSKIIIRIDNKKYPTYCFQKDYHKWNVIKIDNIIKNDNESDLNNGNESENNKNKGIIKIDNRALSKLINNKNQYIQKPILNKIYCPAPEILEYLNQKTGKKFSLKSKHISSLISARFNEGHTIEDFQKVIDLKTSQWLNDPKMDAYLRPKTLFSASNFESYLNERGTGGNGNGSKEDWEHRIDSLIHAAKKSATRIKNPSPPKISTTDTGSDGVEVSNDIPF